MFVLSPEIRYNILCMRKNSRLERRVERHKELHRILNEHAKDILESENFKSTRNHVQHGSIPVHRHCIDVAKQSLLICRALKIKVNERELVRGALLHDYFLYDWHDIKDFREGLHGYRHPQRALDNASKEYKLSNREKDIISKHMWPLTLTKVPMYRESWIVTMADKYCSSLETLKLRKGALNRKKNG